MAHREPDKQIWRTIKSGGALGGCKIQRGHWRHEQNNLSGKWGWKFIVDPGFEFTSPSRTIAIKQMKDLEKQWPAK